MRGGRAAVALLLAGVLAGAFPTAAAAEDTVAFTIRDRRITESSGLARDVSGGLYWTINDSGAAGVVYGLEPDGRLRGTFGYRAAPTDVEAIAVHENRLYVADIGDNAANRDMVTVYYFLNPRATGLTVTYNAYDFRYPDGPHDAETLLVDDAGRLYVVTKGAQGGIYAAPQTPTRTATNVLRRVGDAPALVTDGVFLPDGRGIALLTYGSVQVLDATSYQPVASTPVPAPLRQAESLAVSLDGSALLVGSEGSGSKVYSLPVPGAAAATATPSASASPTASPPPSDSGADESDTDSDATATPSTSRRGTLLAVGLAGVVALVAGVVVGLVRRPG